MKTKALIFLLLLTGFSLANQTWDRYAVILEREPFGKEPLPEKPTVAARPDGEFAKQYRLCMLCKDSQGRLKAGLVSKVNNKNFFLQVGESDDGLSLVDVHLEEGIAILQQGTETAQLLLKGLDIPAASPSQNQAAVASTSTAVPAQIIRRAGAAAASPQLLARLTDSAPKRPRLTVRKSVRTERSIASVGTGSPGKSEERLSGNYGHSTAPAEMVASIHSPSAIKLPGNYSISRNAGRFLKNN